MTVDDMIARWARGREGGRGMDEEPPHTIASIASALAAYQIKRHLAAGGTIHIPSLGITIGGEMTNHDRAAGYCGDWELINDDAVAHLARLLDEAEARGRAAGIQAAADAIRNDWRVAHTVTAEELVELVRSLS